MNEVDVKVLLAKYQEKISELTNLVIFYESLIETLTNQLKESNTTPTE
jgi:hypothetical protein